MQHNAPPNRSFGNAPMGPGAGNPNPNQNPSPNAMNPPRSSPGGYPGGFQPRPQYGQNPGPQPPQAPGSGGPPGGFNARPAGPGSFQQSQMSQSPMSQPAPGRGPAGPPGAGFQPGFSPSGAQGGPRSFGPGQGAPPNAQPNRMPYPARGPSPVPPPQGAPQGQPQVPPQGQPQPGLRGPPAPQSVPYGRPQGPQFGGPPGAPQSHDGRFGGPPTGPSTPGVPGQGQFQSPQGGQLPRQSSHGPGQYPPGPMSGPPGPVSGPPGRMSGPPGPGQMSGPPGPGQMRGPPGPGHMSGPPGPPGPGQMPGPPGPPGPGQMPGPPGPAGPPGPGGYPPQQPGQYYPQGQMPPNAAPGAQQGGPAAPGGYGAQNQQPRQRIDPNQIPRPIVGAERVTYVARGHTVTMPPSASSDFVCVDEGCCNPRFIRPTLNHVPATREVLKQCSLPLAAVICPLADLKEDELPIPLVDFGPNGPLRCTRCNAYVNCFTKFIQGGRKFVCNICTLHNETPRDYYCSVDQNGRRRDVQERAELSRGSVDYVVPPAYTVRTPQEPIYAFLIDVSMFAFQSGLAQASLEAIKYLLPSLCQNRRKKVGIITFDSAVHYYRMDHASSISLCVCPDVDDPPAPLPASSWLVSMEDPNAPARLTELADLILTTFKSTTKNQAVSGAALWSVVDALAECGGRAILLQAGPPRIGIGKVEKDEPSGAYGTTREVELYTPDNTPYDTIAKTCAQNHICLDVFSVANPFASLAEIGRVCEVTGGRVTYMPQFEKEKPANQRQLSNALLRLATRETGYEAVLKVRVSAGLRVERSLGNFYNATRGLSHDGYNVDEMEFAVIDQDRSICVTFAHDETLPEGGDVFIQAALLYTRSDGIRCVRVHNLALPVEPLLSNVFRFADLDATCAVWQRGAVKEFCDRSVMHATPTAVKDNLVNECVNVLFNYRKYCASSSSSGQLILPESLKLLPLYTLATLKSRGLRANLLGNPPRGFIDVRADERVMMLGLLNSLPVEFAVSAVYPKLYSVHDMAEDCCTFNENGKFILPPQLPPTAEKLEENGIFLLHSAMTCYLYVGPHVETEILMELFGTDHVDSAEQMIDIYEKLENESEDGLREKLRSLVEYLNSIMPMSQPLEILTKTDWRANRFMSALVEDRTRNDVSYVEFLCQVHKKIQYKFH